MNVELITTILQAIITIATGGFVIKVLKEKIKSQKEQLDMMKDIGKFASIKKK